jgi:hypothetical protein
VKRFFLIVVIVIVVAIAWEGIRRAIPSSVDYQGQKIKLSKFYLDYDDYKNDPDNIAPSETERVQRLVMGAPIAASFSGRKEAVDAVFEVKFPGYGCGGMGSVEKGDGALNGMSVEIPRTDKDRYFIFQNAGGSYKLVDDFVASGISDFHQEGTNLVYTGLGGQKFTHPMKTH